MKCPECNMKMTYTDFGWCCLIVKCNKIIEEGSEDKNNIPDFFQVNTEKYGKVKVKNISDGWIIIHKAYENMLHFDTKVKTEKISFEKARLLYQLKGEGNNERL